MENGVFFALTFRELSSCLSGSGQAELRMDLAF